MPISVSFFIHRSASKVSFRRENYSSVLIFSLVAVVCPLGGIALAWGSPISEEMFADPFDLMRVDLLGERYAEVIQTGGVVLEQNPVAPVLGMLGVAYAGIGQFEWAAGALKRAEAAGEPNHPLFTHISQALFYRSRGEFGRQSRHVTKQLSGILSIRWAISCWASLPLRRGIMRAPKQI